jgi:integrase/recombinase XerD
MPINRYRYFYACAFSVFDEHLVAFVDEMVALEHAESTVKLYLSCINDIAKAMDATGIAACDLDAWNGYNPVKPMQGSC